MKSFFRRKSRELYREIHRSDRIFYWILKIFGSAVIVLLLAMVLNLLQLALPAFQKVGAQFFVTNQWNPVQEDFGALAFIFGTLVSSLVAILIAVPVSLGVSLFLNELAPPKVAVVIGFLVEMLAAIPSVVYGLWGIFVLAPWLQGTIEPPLAKYLGFIPLFQGPANGIGMLCAGVILAVMITPTISALSREVFKSIPNHQREAALALGATRWESIRLGVLKASTSGLVGAVMLGFGRALGETMAVTMVIGNRPQISASLFAPAQTMASLIANEYAEATGAMHLSSLGAVGLALFGVSLLVNGCARIIVWHVQKEARA